MAKYVFAPALAGDAYGAKTPQPSHRKNGPLSLASNPTVCPGHNFTITYYIIPVLFCKPLNSGTKVVCVTFFSLKFDYLRYE